MTAATASGIDRYTFRQVTACFPTSAPVVTALDAEGTTRGLTATPSTSVSPEPPLLLVSVHRMSRTLPAIQDAGGLAVDTTELGRAPIARRVGCRAEDEFGELVWSSGVDGGPVPGDLCVAWGECHTRHEREAINHHAFIGAVVYRGLTDDTRRPYVCFGCGAGRRTELEG